MKSSHNSQHGQVLIIFVFAIIGLIGITGLAIDGSNILSDRRHAQNAADTASMAAALYRNRWAQTNGRCDGFSTENPSTLTGCRADVATRAMDVAKLNGYNSDNMTNRVDVYNPPVDGPYKDCTQTSMFNCNDYIEVKIHTNVNTWFAKVLGVSTLHNTVNANALSQYAPPQILYGGNSLVELRPSNPSCSGDFTFGGNHATIELVGGGGIWVNSSSACAYAEGSNCPTLIMSPLPGDPAPMINVFGGTHTSGCTEIPTNIVHPTYQYPFPPDLITPPAECIQSPIGNYIDAAGVSHLNPGHYTLLPPDRTTVMAPGVYCVDSVLKTTNPTTLSGTGIFIYIEPGGSFNFQGGAVNLTGGTPKYGNYVIYQSFNPDWYYQGLPAGNCTINAGAGDMQFTGVIYAPFCDVTVNGGSTPYGLNAQIIAYTLKINGSTYLKFLYDDKTKVIDPGDNNISLMR